MTTVKPEHRDKATDIIAEYLSRKDAGDAHASLVTMITEALAAAEERGWKRGMGEAIFSGCYQLERGQTICCGACETAIRARIAEGR